MSGCWDGDRDWSGEGRNEGLMDTGLCGREEDVKMDCGDGWRAL